MAEYLSKEEIKIPLVHYDKSPEKNEYKRLWLKRKYN